MDVFTENSLHDNFALACLASYRIVENMQHAKVLQFFLSFIFFISYLQQSSHCCLWQFGTEEPLQKLHTLNGIIFNEVWLSKYIEMKIEIIMANGF